MITENYVSYEVAKLLKDKGFDGVCRYYYPDCHTNLVSYVDCRQYNIFNNESCIAPTHQMACKWLREEHNLFIFPFPQMNTNKFWTEIYQLSDNQEWENLYCESIDLQDYSAYEEAVEAALKYCLENLI